MLLLVVRAGGKSGSSKALVDGARALGIAALINTMRDFPTRAGVQWRALNVLRELASESGANLLACVRVRVALFLLLLLCVGVCLCAACLCTCVYECLCVTLVCAFANMCTC